MKVYWCNCGTGHGNFGDRLTPMLLRHLGVSCEWSAPENADLIGIGSLLESVPEEFQGTIWTTGFMHADSRKNFAHANVVAVRGKLSRARVASQNAALGVGDAGLLCDLFYKSSRKHYKLGVIPHYVDAGDPIITRFADSSSEIVVIDICADPLDIIKKVGECEYVISSSLHGLIAADSLGVPNHWIELNRSSQSVLGNGFKFMDYYSVFGIADPHPDTLEPDDDLSSVLSRCRPYCRNMIYEVKERLLESLKNLTAQQPRRSRNELRLEEETERQGEQLRRQWLDRLGAVETILLREVPSEATLLLADENQIDRRLPFRRIHSFSERDGQYWGAPATDDLAVTELERMRTEGAEYFAIAWPAFWLFDDFARFGNYLNVNYACLFRNENVAIYDLNQQDIN